MISAPLVKKYKVTIVKEKQMDAKTAFYAFYILMWPALTLGVLVYICRAVWKDAKAAKENNEDLV